MTAYNFRNTNRYRVRFANFAALSNLDGLLVAFFAANSCANGLGAAFWNHGANIVAHGLGAAFWNHLANGVVANLGAAFGFHTANRIVANLGAAFWNHLAYGVVANLLTVFTYHGANGVGAGLGTAFRNHLANCVVASLGAALWDHVANCVVAGLGAALRNHAADRVRYFTSAALGYVLGAADFLGFAGRNPNLLANGLWWALYAFYSAFAWAVHALASARIIGPSTWFADGSADDRTGDFFGNCVPMTTSDLDRLGVLNWLGDGVVFRTYLVLNNFVINSVVDRTSLGLIHWLHDSVVDFTSTSFVHWLHNRVVDLTSLGLVHWLLNRVVDHSLLLFVNRLHHGVVDDPLLLLIHRLLNCVVDRSALGLINGRHHRVVDLTGLLLGMRNHHRVLNFTRLGFWNHACSVDDLVFVVGLHPSSVTSLLLLFVNRFANCSHYGVRTAAAGRAIDNASAYFSAVSDNFAFRHYRTATTALIADCAAVCGVGGSRSRSNRSDCQGRNHPQPFHVLSPKVFVRWIDRTQQPALPPTGGRCHHISFTLLGHPFQARSNDERGKR